MIRPSIVGRTFALAVLALLLVIGALWLSAAPAAAQSQTTVIVQRGDTLSKIAARHCTTWQEIYRLNQAAIGPNPSLLRAGTRLLVPSHCGAPGGVWDRGARRYAMGSFNAPWYTVARGDTLTSIGLRFGVSVQAIRSANSLAGSAIHPGQRLRIPGSGDEALPPPVEGIERVRFASGAVSASRAGAIQPGAMAKSYVLRALAGQTLEVYTLSGEPLTVGIATAEGTALGTWGTNKSTQNSVFAALPWTTDYVVTLIAGAPLVASPPLAFDVTFVIR